MALNKHKTILLRQIFGIVITMVLVVLPTVGIFYLMGSKRFVGMFTYVFSGRLFVSGWDRIHAGSALDQPTIGKWYFWFTVFTVFCLPYMGAVRQFWVRSSKVRYWIFVIGITVLCLFLVCLLTIPFFWLIQYIDAMGITSRRIAGILYGIGGYGAVLLFYVWSIRPNNVKQVFSQCNTSDSKQLQTA
jgi:hypothetical protein